MVFFHFKFLQANFRGEKGGNFMVGPGRHLASLRHCVSHKCILNATTHFISVLYLICYRTADSIHQTTSNNSRRVGTTSDNLIFIFLAFNFKKTLTTLDIHYLSVKPAGL